MEAFLIVQKEIRKFLKVRTSYDVLPMSFRLIILDNSVLIRKSLNILIQNRTPKTPWLLNTLPIIASCRGF